MAGVGMIVAPYDVIVCAGVWCAGREKERERDREDRDEGFVEKVERAVIIPQTLPIFGGGGVTIWGRR